MKGSEKLYLVQCMRFLAAGLVLVGHLLHEVGGGAEAGLVDWNGGVDIFFATSGFIMYLQSASRFGDSDYARLFLWRRFIRIAPPYWLFTTLMLVATLGLARYLDHAVLNPEHVVASYAFLPWPNELGQMHPLLGVGWTLNYEMLFYLVFGAALLFRGRAGIAVMLTVFLTLMAAAQIAPQSAWIVRYWGNPIIMEFLFGIGIAFLRIRGLRFSVPAAVVVGSAGAMLLVGAQAMGLTDGQWRFVGAGIPAALITSAFALSTGPVRKGAILSLLVLLGDASYALYLSHPFTINVVKLAGRRLGLAPAEFVSAGLVAAVIVSVFVYLAFELPLLKLLQAAATRRTPGTIVTGVSP